MKPLMPPIDTPDKLFHDGNPATGAEGTIVPAEHLNNEQASIRDLQSEMIAILTAAAMAPDSTAGQLLAALNKLYAPGNDTLGALASLVGAANKLPYFTGPKGAALTDLTAFARTLLSRSDAAGVLSDLGLGNLKYGASLIGQLIEWPLQQMPHEIWTDCGMEFIPYMAQSFDPVKYPLLAQLHPTNVLPADMRGYVARGWDNARGVDSGRALMSLQEDAMQALKGDFGYISGGVTVDNELFYPVTAKRTGHIVASKSGDDAYVGFDSSRVARTATETRSKNVAWNFIVRAK